jgi:2-oxoglutarate/2-oxoacid ferredoxin oxidoreductase subunit beta
MTEMLALSPGVVYAARTSVHNPTYVMKAKKSVRTAFEALMRNEGMTVLEILSTCNSGWKMTPVAALQWLEKNMVPVFPLGEIKTPAGDSALTPE